MSKDPFDGLFDSFLSPLFGTEDQKKASALIRVAAKSAASLADIVLLADALDLRLMITAEPKPEPKTEETEAAK